MHVVRRATKDDVDSLYALELQFGDEAMSRSSLKRHVTNENAVMVLTEEAGTVTAYALCLLRKNSKKARLYSICVDMNHRGKGLGRELLEEVEYVCEHRGCTHVTLEVSADNVTAKNLYETAGYVRFGLYPAYYSDGSDALRMRKKLTP